MTRAGVLYTCIRYAVHLQQHAQLFFKEGRIYIFEYSQTTLYTYIVNVNIYFHCFVIYFISIKKLRQGGELYSCPILEKCVQHYTIES